MKIKSFLISMFLMFFAFAQNPWMDLHFPFFNPVYLQKFKVSSITLVHISPSTNQPERMEKFFVNQLGLLTSYIDFSSNEKRVFNYSNNQDLISQIIYSGKKIDTIHYMIDSEKKIIYEIFQKNLPNQYTYEIFKYSYSFNGELFNVERAEISSLNKMDITLACRNAKFTSCFNKIEKGYAIHIANEKYTFYKNSKGFIDTMTIEKNNHKETWTLQYDVVNEELVLIEKEIDGLIYKVFVTYETR